MLKKISLVAVVAVAGALSAGAIAYADGYTIEDELIQHEVSECEHNILSGALTIPHDDDSTSKSNDDVDCDQDVSPEDD